MRLVVFANPDRAHRGESVTLSAILGPWLDRHAEAILAHARMLYPKPRGIAVPS
jgi:hypothetical protein